MDSADLGADRQQDAQMILGEGVALGVISVSTPSTPFTPSSGTATAERSVENFAGSFR